jgi:predicted nucleic acid-binding protein
MVLADNNILSSFAKIDRLDLLNQLFEDVSTTPSVLDELHKDAVAGFTFVERVDAIKSYKGGWLQIISPSEREIELTDEILDASLSYTDAECIAVSESRGEPLVTDDGHAGEIATQRGVEVWDLKLLIAALLKRGLIQDESELDEFIVDLREQDSYRFSKQDRDHLYSQLKE